MGLWDRVAMMGRTIRKLTKNGVYLIWPKARPASKFRLRSMERKTRGALATSRKPRIYQSNIPNIDLAIVDPGHEGVNF